MPCRSILSGAERDSLVALLDTQDELIAHYTFSESDLSLIRQRRGDANRLGVAVPLCLLRFPGQVLMPDATVPIYLLQWIGRQLQLDPPGMLAAVRRARGDPARALARIVSLSVRRAVRFG